MDKIKMVTFQVFIILLPMCIHCSVYKENYTDEILLIINFFKMQAGASQIVAYTCWSKSKFI